MRNPLWLLNTAPLIKQYPQEALLAMLDYPKDYLQRWDKLNQVFPHTGVAANDSHQNVGVRLRLIEADKVQVEDALGEKILEFTRKAAQELVPIAEDAKEGDVLFELLLDPYEVSLRHAGTYILASDQTEEAVWQALLNSRAYVCFDGLASGRDVQWFASSASGNQRTEIGGSLSTDSSVIFRGQSPQLATWRILRDGEEVHKATGYTCEFETSTPGIYRAELWLDIGVPQIWVLTNPITLKSSP